jgi:serine-threonine kinase receptor-associated protein
LLVQGAVWSHVMNEPALLCATGSADFTARVWDACSGLQMHEFSHPHIVRSCNFSKHNNMLATGCE